MGEDKKYLARFVNGTGIIAQNNIDYYIDENNKIIEHRWANAYT